MAESGFSRFIPPNLRQPLAEAGALGYQLLDNVVGFDDGYDSMGELLGRSLREDPVGTAGSIASGVVDSVKAAYEDPFGTLSALGDEFAGAYEMLSAPMNLSAGREEVGKRLEAASLLSSVVPGLGVAGAGTKALGGAAANAVDAARRAPDDAFNVEMNRLLDEQADEVMLPAPAQLAPDPRTADLERLRQLQSALDNEGFFDPDLYGLSIRRDIGEFDDLLSEDDLRNNFRYLRSEHMTGMLSPEAMRAQGVSEEEISRIYARYQVLENQFPDVFEEATDDPFAQVPFVFDEPDDFVAPPPGLPGFFDRPGVPSEIDPYTFSPDAFDNDTGLFTGRQKPLTWGDQGAAGSYSRSARAAQDLRQPTYSSLEELKSELLARKASGAELALNGDRLEDLFASSNSGRVSREAVQDALRNAPGLELLRTEEYADIGPRGGENYTSTVYTHPSVKRGPAQAYKHFGDDKFFRGQRPPDPPPLFHTRAAQYDLRTGTGLNSLQEKRLLAGRDASDYRLGRRGASLIAHHVLEIQSDWSQFRQSLPSTQEKRVEMENELVDLRSRKDAVRGSRDLPPFPRELELRIKRLQDALATGMLRGEYDERFPVPLFKKQDDWVDAGVRQNLLDAVNAGSDWITFGNGIQASTWIGMPEAAAKRFYDNDVPLSVERVLRKLSREARTEFPELQDVPFVDGETVKGLRITPELREALLKNGLPSFRDGGMVSDQTSRVGRPLYENPDGSYYSEVTVTFPFEGKWLTFPSVDESGNILSEDEVFDYVKKNGPVDPITGETFPFFETLEDAESFARDRSKGLINFRDGGMVTASEYLLAGRQY
jgi:hypothetical protein